MKIIHPSKKEILSNFAQLIGVPVISHYPPSFVITWDKKRHIPKMMKGKHFLSNEDAQTGGIVMMVLGLFIIGFLYIILGYIEGFYVTMNNNLITNHLIPYSQDHADSMTSIYNYWWAIPVLAIICFGIYAIKNATQNQPGESY